MSVSSVDLVTLDADACTSLAVERIWCQLTASRYRHAPAETVAAGMLAAYAGGCPILAAERLHVVRWAVLAAFELAARCRAQRDAGQGHQRPTGPPVAGVEQAAAAVSHPGQSHQRHTAPFVAGVEQAGAAGRFVAVARVADHALAKHGAHVA